jgi:hypothetical protein
LGGVGTGGISSGGEFHHALFVPFTATFNKNEHAPRLQALGELSNGFGIVCYLRRIDISIQVVSEMISEYILLNRPFACGPRPFGYRSVVIPG